MILISYSLHPPPPPFQSVKNGPHPPSASPTKVRRSVPTGQHAPAALLNSPGRPSSTSSHPSNRRTSPLRSWPLATPGPCTHQRVDNYDTTSMRQQQVDGYITDHHQQQPAQPGSLEAQAAHSRSTRLPASPPAQSTRPPPTSPPIQQQGAVHLPPASPPAPSPTPQPPASLPPAFSQPIHTLQSTSRCHHPVYQAQAAHHPVFASQPVSPPAHRCQFTPPPHAAACAALPSRASPAQEAGVQRPRAGAAAAGVQWGRGVRVQPGRGLLSSSHSSTVGFYMGGEFKN